ncbi:Metal-dependent transcriptional regulator [Planctomycetales bacterium 10988]|nr:Metal-dependent transcriptional regulator [Planctomycetales bacterium 10988]
MVSLTVENYVKAIYTISLNQEGRPASTGQIASCLEVAPGTVTSMLKALSESGLAQYTPYEGVRLTQEGKALALNVLRRHRLIEVFLVQTLGMSWTEVHEEAERLEHAVSDKLVERVDAFLGYPSFDPHGDPIPTADGSVSAQIGVPLSECQVEGEFKLIRVLDQSPQFLKELTEKNLLIGREGILISPNPEVDHLVLKINGEQVQIPKELAHLMVVKFRSSTYSA